MRGAKDMNRKAFGFRAPLIVLAAVILFAGAAAAGFSEEKIQLAILLDTSNSMDGLIEQAKAQLWKVVNELARTTRHGVHPTLEVALFQYGNDGLSEQTGYIQMVSNLTTDLDRISEKLFTLTTNGGSEYCGQVIERAVSRLSWSSSNDVLKVIYIAGNEPFTQGSVDYTASDSKAIRRGIIVNTIFCGPFDEGVATSWKDGADRADGRYMSINQDEVAVSIPTPYDKDIVKLGDELNGTYVAYGHAGAAGAERQAAQDANAASMSPAAPVERSVAKAQAAYSNAGWDLVDAVKNKDVKLGALKEEQLPAQMQKMSPAEREKYIQGLAGKRADLQAKINGLNEKRRVFLANQMKQSTQGNTLDTAILGSVKAEAAKKGFIAE
jgi:von Willebrand factor type A domain